MDIRRLQAFVNVYELRSFSKAGEALRVSQPTISAHIMALEEELGAPLFDRLGRTVLPTPAGDVLHRYATKILIELDHATADILALSNRVSGSLVIGGSTIPAHYILPRQIASFASRYPEVHIDLQGGDTDSIAAMVAAGTVHIGVIGAPASQSELVSLPLLDDDLVLVGPLDAPFLRSFDSARGNEALLGLPWIMREPGSGTRHALDQALRRIGLDCGLLQTALQVHTSLAVLECVEAGIGVAAVSRLAAKPYLDRKAVRELPSCSLDMQRHFYAVFHGKRYVFPALRLFLVHLGVKETRDFQ